jgi:hypothetical protein
VLAYGKSHNGRQEGNMTEKSKRVINQYYTQGGGNAVYFFGMIGAMVYYIQQSASFWEAVIGILKALVWPAFVIYELLVFLIG